MSDTAAMVAFYRARLDEDEAAAKAVEPLGHVFDMGGTRLDEAFSHARIKFVSADGWSYRQPDPAAERHFARHDPPRVLREVEAGRKLLARRQEVGSRERGWDGTECDNDLAELLDGLIRDRIAVYSDHPDYREEWKP